MKTLKEVDLMYVESLNGYEGMVFAITTENDRYYMGMFKNLDNDGRRISLYELQTPTGEVMTVDWYLLKMHCKAQLVAVK